MSSVQPQGTDKPRMPTTNEELQAADIFAATTNGAAYSVLKPQEQEIARAACRVAIKLSEQPLPGVINNRAGDFFNGSAEAGGMLEKAILNTLIRMTSRPDQLQTTRTRLMEKDLMVERSIHGEMKMMADAKYMLQAINDPQSRDSSLTELNAGADAAAQYSSVIAGIKSMAKGDYRHLGGADQLDIAIDVMYNKNKPEDMSRLAEIRDSEEKGSYDLAALAPALPTARGANYERVHQVITYGQSSGNADRDDAFRAVHRETVGEHSLLQSARGTYGETVTEAYDRMLKAGAHVIELNDKGIELTAKQAARFMLNEIELMQTASHDGGAGHLKLENASKMEMYAIGRGTYADLSPELAEQVHTRLVNQPYVAPALLTAVSLTIDDNAAMAGPEPRKQINASIAAAAHSQGMNY